jgi:hypothetical protein
MLIQETHPRFRSSALIHVERAYDFDESRGLWMYRQEEDDEVAHNLVLSGGIDQLFIQGYATTGLATNGFNYIALSNSAGTSLSGTFNVSNGSANVTASTSQTGSLYPGATILFTSDTSDTVYTVLSVSGTAIVLTGNYTGTSYGATAATAVSYSDTTLSGELTTNGLGRTQGTYAHTTGTTTATISHTFTYTGGSSQAVQLTALFNASSAGAMNNEILFTQRTLYTNDTLAVTYTITI